MEGNTYKKLQSSKSDIEKYWISYVAHWNSIIGDYIK